MSFLQGMRNKITFVCTMVAVLGVFCADATAGRLRSSAAKPAAIATTPPAPVTINGATFSVTDMQATATSTFNPFLRVSHAATVQASNAAGTAPPPAGKPTTNYQKALEQSSLATFTVNGVQCYKFVLAANQTGRGSQTLSVNQLQISTSSTGTAADAKIAYSLNISGTANSLSTTGVGKGVANIYAYIPVSMFDQSAKYIVLSFSASSNYRSKSGFEEWSAAVGPLGGPVASVPDTANSVGLAAIGFGALVALHRASLLRRRRVRA